jgi:hypothetical protein
MSNFNHCSRHYFQAKVSESLIRFVRSRQDSPRDKGLSVLVVHQLLELFQQQLCLHPPHTMRKYYKAVFGPKIPVFVDEAFKKTNTLAAVSILDEGLLVMVVDVLKKDCDYWWKHQRNKKTEG